MKIDFFKKVILSLILIMALLFIIMFGVKSNPFVNHYNITGYDFVLTAKYHLLEKPSKAIKKYVKSFANYEQATKELEIMQQYVDNMALLNELYNETRRENEKLKELLELKATLTEFEMKSATVISHDMDGWNDFLTIDLGKNDGIRENLAVITPEGLIGKIYMVSDNVSVVRLLTSDDGLSKVALRIQQEESVEALLESYDTEKRLLQLRVLDNNTEIEIGSKVVTSPFGGVYPSGLLVGTVESVETMDYMLGKIVCVKPNPDFDHVEHVNVIIRSLEEENDND